MDQSVSKFIDNENRIKTWPKKQTDKLKVLDYLLGKFETNKTYTEKEVNEILKSWHTFSDWPLLRRSIIDYGLMSRDINGIQYKRIK